MNVTYGHYELTIAYYGVYLVAKEPSNFFLIMHALVVKQLGVETFTDYQSTRYRQRFMFLQ